MQQTWENLRRETSADYPIEFRRILEPFAKPYDQVWAEIGQLAEEAEARGDYIEADSLRFRQSISTHVPVLARLRWAERAWKQAGCPV